MSGISGSAIAASTIGGVLLYSGLKGKGISNTFRSIIAGQNPNSVAQSTGIIPGIDNQTTTDNGTLVTESPTQISEGAPTYPNQPSGTPATNQNYARLLAAPYGWSTGQNWTDLVSLWNRESGWSNTADNPSSHAYGIAQALPSTKYPVSGRPPSEGGSSSATAQITWGLQYIKSRYGSPSAAWAHETANSWY